MKTSLISIVILAACLVFQHADAQESETLRKQFQEYKVKAEKNDDEAQFNLANCYAKGIGVEKNEPEAVKWYRKAAENGHFEAHDSLIDC